MNAIRILAAALICLVSSSAFAQQKAWTVLVYVSGFNDLDDYGKLNLNQMEKVGSSDQVNVVVEWGSYSSPKSTKRMLITKDNDPSKVTSPVLQELGKVDMGQAQTLKEFLLWGVSRFPADRYLVVVWDHGTGWHFKGARPLHDISLDDISGNEISTEDLGKVIREVSQHLGRKLDIYASDACSMGMAEVAGEMATAVDYFAGSQELEPVEGWPYDVILGDLVQNPGMSPADLGDLIARSYVKLYAGKDDATYSVYNMNYFSELEHAVGRLAGEIRSLSQSDRMTTLQLVQASQSFTGDYGDLGDFVRRMQAQGLARADVLVNVQQDLQNLVTANYMTDKYPNTRGVSIWLPQDKETWNTYRKRYSGLGFEKRTRWAQAIAAYLN